jgi:hypothetical protein
MRRRTDRRHIRRRQVDSSEGLIENIIERVFQLCAIDPEGDYADLEGALVLGDAKSPPRLPEIVELLGKPEQNVVVNLLGVDVAERPRFLSELMPALSSLRVETARPHWLVIDEAHHLLPSAWNGAPLILPQEFAATILITVQPEHVAAEALQRIEHVLALATKPTVWWHHSAKPSRNPRRRRSGKRSVTERPCCGTDAPVS